MTTSDGGAEATRLLGAAEQLLAARDLARSRSLAQLALEADPLLDGPECVLAAADVLLAAQSRHLNNHVDWYAVLQIDPFTAPSASVVRIHYRRLALLLRPDPRRGDFGLFHPVSSSFSFSTSYAVAAEAFKLVCDAWAVLSDPTKKALYDKEIAIAASKESDGGCGDRSSGNVAGKKGSAEEEIDAVATFWTACTSCCYVHQYSREYEGQSLVCQNCRKAFKATEFATPPVVPGTDMYFCAWGLFPLGFPGGPKFIPNPAAVSSGSKRTWRVGRKKKDSYNDDKDWMPRNAKLKQNTAKKGNASNGLVNENNARNETAGVPGSTERPVRKTRANLMASGRKRLADGAEESDSMASEEESVDPAAQSDKKAKQGFAIQSDEKATHGVETRLDETNDSQKAGSSKAVDVCMEDLNLNFSIDVNAAAAIIESMGMSTLNFSKDEDVVVVDQLW